MFRLGLPLLVIVIGVVLYNTFVAGGGTGGYDTSRMAETSRYASCTTGADANGS
mgnify:CR=1 FL=1